MKIPRPLLSSVRLSPHLLLCLGLLALPACRSSVKPLSEEERVMATLLGAWRLDVEKTRSASHAATPEAEEAKATVQEFLESEAAPELVAAIRNMQADGAPPQWLADLVKALKSGLSLNEALEKKPLPQDPYGDLALALRFADGKLAIGDGGTSWGYSLDKIDPNTGRTILRLGEGDQAWSLTVKVGEETMTVHPEPPFFSKVGMSADLPASTVLVLVRNP